MKQTVNFSTFQMAFEAIRPDNFTYEGLSQLFDYFQSYENDTGEEIELDVIAICCEYEETTIEDIAKAYNLDENEDILEFLAMNTFVIGRTDNSIVFQSF
jgi:hypothetical protein